MIISKKTKYALKALLYLASRPSGQPVLISDLAREEAIPKKFLEYILLTLRKGGILHSRVGKGGGYNLSLPPAKVSLGMVVRTLEGDLAPVPCLSETNYSRCEECDDERTCGIRLVMVDVNKALTGAFDSLTLADMLERSEAERQKQSNVVDFSI
jgi:Rrf2 family protein